MQVISFASSKGGVGKSTTAGALAAYKSAQGSRVHIMDVDPNRYSLSRMLNPEPWPGATIESVTSKEFSSAYKALIERGDLSHLFIDLPGVREVTLIKAAQRSDLVIIPAQHSVQDVGEALEIIGDLSDAGETMGRPIPYRVLFTQVRNLVSKLDKHVEAEITSEGVERFGAFIKDRVAYREMWANGVAPHQRDEKAKDELSLLDQEIEALLAGSDGIRKVGAA